VASLIQEWLLEMAWGFAKIFIHPVFYFTFLLAAFLGVSRVKRERSHFHVRAENAYYELRQLLPLGLLLGLGMSIIMIAAGVVIPFAAILFIAVLTMVLSIRVRLLSSVYTVGLAFFALFFTAGKEWSIPFFPELFSSLEDKLYPSITVLLALLVISEGILILKNGKQGTSPKLMTSRRGQRVGVHELKRVWMLPLLLLIPGDALQQLPFQWWPVLDVNGEGYGLLFVPFALGHYQHIQGALPAQAVSHVGKQIMAHGFVLTALAIASYWMPILSVAVVAIGILGREVIYFSQKTKEESGPFYFSKQNQGVMILGVLPYSPAQKMQLSVGEIISKVNGTMVRNEAEVYEALQRNRAHCKLEVLDVNGQVRFVQRALYEGDHHELGILFVQDEKKWGTEAV
jgi:hypothetical protein